MNWILVGWIAAGIIISEIIFIIWYKNESHFSWGFVKFFSFLVGGCFMFLQSGIVFATGCPGRNINTAYCYPLNPHYEYLLIELAVIAFVALLVILNRYIVKKIDEAKENE